MGKQVRSIRGPNLKPHCQVRQRQRVVPPKVPNDLPLIRELRSIAIGKFHEPVIINDSLIDFQREEAIRLHEEKISALIEDSTNLVEETDELRNRFQGLGLDLEDELEERLETGNKKKNYVIFSMLLILGDGSSEFMAEELAKERGWSHFDDLIEYLNDLDSEKLASFIYMLDYSVFLDYHLERLVKSMLMLQNRESVIKSIKQSIQDSYVPLYPSCNFMPQAELKRRKQLVLLGILEKVEKETNFNDIAKCFKSPGNWDVLEKAADLLTKHFKENASKMFLYYAKDDDESSKTKRARRAASIEAYARINKTQGFQNIVTIAKDSNGLVGRYAACDALVHYCGRRGTNYIENLIAEATKQNLPSEQLAFLCVGSSSCPAYNSSLERLFSSDLGLKDQFLRLHDSKLRAIIKWPRLSIKLVKPTLSRLVASVGMEGRFAKWIMYEGNTTLGQNAKEILELALDLDKKNILRKGIESYLKSSSNEAKKFRKWIGA